MIGLVYKDEGIDKIMTITSGVIEAVVPASITSGSNVLTMASLAFFESTFFTSRQSNSFRLVNISIVQDDDFIISETKTGISGEKICLVSDDDLDIVAYRSSAYQIVSISSLLISEMIDIGELSFSDMQTVMTVASGLTSPQKKYVRPVGNDTVTFTEIT